MARFRLHVTDETVADHFDGILIECNNVLGRYKIPGWKCQRCGWIIATSELPPEHWCPPETATLQEPTP